MTPTTSRIAESVLVRERWRAAGLVREARGTIAAINPSIRRRREHCPPKPEAGWSVHFAAGSPVAAERIAPKR